MTLSERLKTCFKIHWNGFFYVIVILLLLPLLFLEPRLQFRSIFVILWAFIWYTMDAAPLVAVALIPIVALPFIGVMDSNDVCMCFTREYNILFLLCNFIAVTMQHCEIVKRKAFFVLSYISCDPRIILLVLMIVSYILTAFLPAAFICSAMMPTIKALLQYLEDINVCKAINEEVVLKDDELPYPSKVATAFYIGVAYATNIGSITTALSSETGLALRHLIKTEDSLSQLENCFQLKYMAVSLPVSLLLLAITIFYLEFIFLGVIRSTSVEAQQITFDKAATKAALEGVANGLPPFNVHMLLVAVLFLSSVVGIIVISVLTPEVNDKAIKYSVNAMLLCFFYFVLPSHFGFCNYFICTAPKTNKVTPSILPWDQVSKFTPWKTFFVHGSSLAFAMVMKNSNLPNFCGGGALMQIENRVALQLGFIGLTVIATIMASNNLLADVMLRMSLKAVSDENATAILYPITWATCLTFLLPVSSLANSFALGWGNVRTKDMLLAGIVPTVFGILLTFLMGFLLSI